MKVLHVLNEIRTSGAEVMLRVAAPIWKSQGLQLSICGKGCELGSFASELEKVGYQIHHCPDQSRIAFAWLLTKLLKENRYDVIHIHTEHRSFDICLLGRSIGHAAVVRTLHSTFLFTGVSRRKRIIQRAVERAIGVRHISIGPSVEHNERTRFLNPTDTIPNWFDTHRFAPPSCRQRKAARAALGLQDVEFVLITVGNCHPVKNHESLLHALTGLESSFVYLHVGDEEAGFPERRLAEMLGIDKRVRFVGSQTDITPYLFAADAFIMPSLKEGFSIAALEAMGAGIPLIASDIPGLRDLEEGCGSIMFVGTDPDSLRNGLVQFLTKDAETRHRIGRRSAEAAHRLYSVDAGATRYMRLYQTLISS